MKKFISLLLVAGLLICALCGCGGSPQKDGKKAKTKESQVAQRDKDDNPSSESSMLYEQEENEPTYYHAAITGAVIVNQDGSPSFVYKNKCESCGRTQSGTVSANATSGTLHGGYHCPFCNTSGQFEIETTQN